jgi:hypothetical protein
MRAIAGLLRRHTCEMTSAGTVTMAARSTASSHRAERRGDIRWSAAPVPSEYGRRFGRRRGVLAAGRKHKASRDGRSVQGIWRRSFTRSCGQHSRPFFVGVVGIEPTASTV